jgi:hypothetical protein
MQGQRQGSEWYASLARWLSSQSHRTRSVNGLCCSVWLADSTYNQTPHTNLNTCLDFAAG